MRNYKYVGSIEHLDSVGKYSSRQRISKPKDVVLWAQQTDQRLNSENEIVVTFIVNTNNDLWIADRHSEHIVCSNGEDVLAAGEITFQIDKEMVEVVEITNQSTGFCPEPGSWTAVEKALDAISLKHPSKFTASFIFRLCDKCRTVNIIKDDFYYSDS